MQNKDFEVLITNDPVDFDLIEEIWINDQLIAMVRKINEEWKVIFFATDQLCELSWTQLSRIYQKFSEFIDRMESPLSDD